MAAAADLVAVSGAEELLAGWARVLVGIDVRVAGLFRALEVAAENDGAAR